MATTFIDLCNQTLRRLNEVEIASAEFNNVRGVQALVKDAVRSAIKKINQAEYEWPFNAAEHTENLVIGQSEYSWPVALKVVEWTSFQIQENDTLGVEFRSLDFIERDQWYDQHRNDDNAAGPTGRDVPQFVFPSHGSGFGVTPSPDEAYTLKFRYWLNTVDLSGPNDLSRIPEDFDHVVVDGALYYMYMYKDNPESAQLTFQAFERGIKDLQSVFINDFAYIYDRRVAFGGGNRNSGGIIPLRSK
jgi:hypothetical protein